MATIPRVLLPRTNEAPLPYVRSWHLADELAEGPDVSF
jgi:hypothetical protein